LAITLGGRWLPGSAQHCSRRVAVAGLQKQVWLLLSAILWLGNIEFDSAGDDMVMVRRDEALANAAALLNLDEDELATALSERVLTAGGLLQSVPGKAWKGPVCP
jgi:myosin heavy subunit